MTCAPKHPQATAGPEPQWRPGPSALFVAGALEFAPLAIIACVTILAARLAILAHFATRLAVATLAGLFLGGLLLFRRAHLLSLGLLELQRRLMGELLAKRCVAAAARQGERARKWARQRRADAGTLRLRGNLLLEILAQLVDDHRGSCRTAEVGSGSRQRRCLDLGRLRLERRLFGDLLVDVRQVGDDLRRFLAHLDRAGIVAFETARRGKAIARAAYADTWRPAGAL